MIQKIESAKALASGAMHMSKRIFLSYVLDWILIIGLAAVGGGFNVLKHTNKRPFSLQDPSITYPVKGDTVSVAVLLVVSLVAPGVITAIVSLLFIPGPTVSKSTSRALIWRRKIWEWNTAWMGLGLSLASAFAITEGLKDLGGKPRPYAIAKCRPDLNNIDQYRVGGLGRSLDTTYDVPIRVSAGICQETDSDVLREIFASWPSGHSSFSFAGLLYLSLFLCAKFAVGIPYTMPDHQATKRNTYDYDNYLRQGLPNPRRIDSADFSSSTAPNGEGVKEFPAPPPRNSAAAPPIYLLLLVVFLPVGTAVFISVSRWFDFRHHGIDILSGALLGAFCAYFSFRYYHMPIRRGSGWSWGARSRSRAFWVGVGRDGYVGEEGWTAAKAAKQNGLGDVESAHKDVVGPGIEDHGDVEGAGGGRSPNVRQEGHYTIQNQS